MDKSLKQLGAIVLTKDSSRRIAETLVSIRRLTDDIIVLDQQSRDATASICERIGAQVIEVERDLVFKVGFAELRRMAISQLTAHWVLTIDSDEVVSHSLADQIRETLAAPGDLAGYRFFTQTLAFGRAVRMLSGYSAYPRLFRRDQIMFDDRRVHEGFVVLGGRIGRLNGPLIHYPYDTWEDLQKKAEVYSELESQQIPRGRHLLSDELIAVSRSLFWSLIMQRGLLDGKLGFQLALEGARVRIKAFEKAKQRCTTLQ